MRGSSLKTSFILTVVNFILCYVIENLVLRAKIFVMIFTKSVDCKVATEDAKWSGQLNLEYLEWILINNNIVIIIVIYHYFYDLSTQWDIWYVAGSFLVFRNIICCLCYFFSISSFHVNRLQWLNDRYNLLFQWNRFVLRIDWPGRCLSVNAFAMQCNATRERAKKKLNEMNCSSIGCTVWVGLLQSLWFQHTDLSVVCTFMRPQWTVNKHIR